MPANCRSDNRGHFVLHTRLATAAPYIRTSRSCRRNAYKRWLFKPQKGINHEAKDGLLQGWQFEFKVLKVRQAMWNRSIPKEMNLDIIQ